MKTILDDRLRRTLLPYPASRRYLIGVSGGVDSVALLHALLGLGYRQLIVCHLDHGLRGKAARLDASWVKRLASRLGLSFHLGRVDVGSAATAAKLSVETAARTARYRFFAETARLERCHTIFLAHHADDQVETLLFNLFRGAGPAGLGGMKLESIRANESSRQRRSLSIVRPLLGVWRMEIEEYARQHKLRWREDASNTDFAHTRNRLRHEIIPLLEKAFGREIRPALWRAADVLGAEDAWLNELLAEDIKQRGELRLGTLQGQPVAKQRRLLRAWLAAHGARGIGYEEIERVRSLWEAPAGPAKVNLPGGWHARRRAGLIFLETT